MHEDGEEITTTWIQCILYIPIKNSCERIFFLPPLDLFHYYGCQRLFAAIRIFIYAIKMERPLVPMRVFSH